MVAASNSSHGQFLFQYRKEAILPSSPIVKAQRAYQEAFSNESVPRSEYSALSAELGFDCLNSPVHLAHKLKSHPLGDHIQIAATPLILSKSSVAQIQTASAQLVKALTLFFEDLVLGDCKIMNSHPGIPKEVISAILRQSSFGDLQKLRAAWAGHSTDEILFLLGGDLFRTPAGSFAFLELNVGNIGGIADMAAVPQAYCALATATPDTLSGFAYNDKDAGPDFFLEALCYYQDVNVNNGEIIAASSHRQDGRFYQLKNRGVAADLEDIRWSDALIERGVRCVARHESYAGVLENASFIINRTIRDEERAAWNAGKVKLLNPPGIEDLLSNKLLLPFVRSIVLFYLGEEPVIPVANSSIARLECKKGNSPILTDLDGKIISVSETVADSGLVVKSPCGYGGDEISVLPPGMKLSSTSFLSRYASQNRPKTTTAADTYLVLQDYLPASELAGMRVDYRPITYAIGGGESITSLLPNIRGQKIPSNPDKRTENVLKTNVAKGAYIVPAFMKV